MKTRKLHTDWVREYCLQMTHNGYAMEQVKVLQVAIYVACGGGMIGRMFAEQPADAYIDDRVGRLPYPKQAIYNMRAVLCEMATNCGLDSHHLPAMPDFHNCAIF